MGLPYSMHRPFHVGTLAVLLFTGLSVAADPLTGRADGPEDFRLELTGSAWLTGPTGTIRANGTPIDLVKDLAAGSHEPRFYGRLVVKPGRKHRLILEGSPISFSGVNTINRSFVFLNRTYNVSQTVSTRGNVNYIFGGYQYDPLSGNFGHLGFQVGVAYLGVDGGLISAANNIDQHKDANIPVPLIGAEFRVFPIPRHKLIQIEGMLRGIPAGGYGYFMEGGASGGIGAGPFCVLAGYREIFADVHQNGGRGDGAAIRLKGPIFSLQWRW